MTPLLRRILSSSCRRGLSRPRRKGKERLSKSQYDPCVTVPALLLSPDYLSFLTCQRPPSPTVSRLRRRPLKSRETPVDSLHATACPRSLKPLPSAVVRESFFAPPPNQHDSSASRAPSSLTAHPLSEQAAPGAVASLVGPFDPATAILPSPSAASANGIVSVANEQPAFSPEPAEPIDSNEDASIDAHPPDPTSSASGQDGAAWHGGSEEKETPSTPIDTDVGTKTSSHAAPPPTESPSLSPAFLSPGAELRLRARNTPLDVRLACPPDRHTGDVADPSTLDEVDALLLELFLLVHRREAYLFESFQLTPMRPLILEHYILVTPGWEKGDIDSTASRVKMAHVIFEKMALGGVDSNFSSLGPDDGALFLTTGHAGTRLPCGGWDTALAGGRFRRDVPLGKHLLRDPIALASAERSVCSRQSDSSGEHRPVCICTLTTSLPYLRAVLDDARASLAPVPDGHEPLQPIQLGELHEYIRDAIKRGDLTGPFWRTASKWRPKVAALAKVFERVFDSVALGNGAAVYEGQWPGDGRRGLDLSCLWTDYPRLAREAGGIATFGMGLRWENELREGNGSGGVGVSSTDVRRSGTTGAAAPKLKALVWRGFKSWSHNPRRLGKAPMTFAGWTGMITLGPLHGAHAVLMRDVEEMRLHASPDSSLASYRVVADLGADSLGQPNVRRIHSPHDDSVVFDQGVARSVRRGDAVPSRTVPIRGQRPTSVCTTLHCPCHSLDPY